MSEHKWRKDKESDELADVAKFFDEFDDTHPNENIGDILYVDGIEDDESVEDEEMLSETEAVTTTPYVATPQLEKSSDTADKTIADVFEVSSTETNEGEMTIGEFFLPLVRQSPPSKIHSEQDTIGSFFDKYLRQEKS